MDQLFLEKLYNSHRACPTCPSPAEVATFFNDLLGTLFAEYTQVNFDSFDAFRQHMEDLRAELDRIVRFNPHRGKTDAGAIAGHFFEALPQMFNKLNED